MQHNKLYYITITDIIQHNKLYITRITENIQHNNNRHYITQQITDIIKNITDIIQQNKKQKLSKTTNHTTQ